MIATIALVAAACGDDAADGGEVTFAWIPWEENIANTNLWAEILEEEGYDVTLTQLDPGLAFDAVATGEVDAFLDVWLPLTHAEYWDEYGDQVADLGIWNQPATIELAVPQYVVDEHGIASLEDLAENPDLFNGQIIGIEAGAGMMGVLANDVMPGYGLDESFTLVDSSTAAMRGELQTAYDNQEPIVVTLWTPHPEYGQKELHRLEDPQGLWGDEEQLHAIGREGLEEDMPEVHDWLSNFELTTEQLDELNGMVDEAIEEGGSEREAAREWIDANRDIVDGWLGR